MAKFSPIIPAMNAGEWSPLLDGRVDLQGYAASSYKLRNFIPTIQGPIVRRAGTGFIRQVKDSADRTWLVPFSRSRSISYMIEFGDLYCRFYYGREPVLTGAPKTITGATAASQVVITSAGHGYSNGDDVFISGVSGMTEINNRWFKVSGATANTFAIYTIHGAPVDGSGYSAYTSGGTIDAPYEIASPYSAGDLSGPNGELWLDFVQDQETVYIAARNGSHGLMKLSRTSANSWAFSDVLFDAGPYEALDTSGASLYVSAATGTITITASAATFTADDVGRIIRIEQETITATSRWEASTAYNVGDFVRSDGKEYEAVTAGTSGTSIPSHTSGTATDGGVEWAYRSAGYGVARITAQAGTTATATVLTRFPQTTVGAGNVSTLWRRGALGGGGNDPTCITIYNRRLVLGRGFDLFFSVAGEYENFAPDYFGEILAESAITVRVGSSDTNEIVGLTEGRVLAVLTEGAEFIVRGSEGGPFGPNNITVARESSFGARPIRPVLAGNTVLFIQPNGQTLLGMQYDFQSNSFISDDQTVRASHILLAGAAQMVRQEAPYQLMWFVDSAGHVFSFTFNSRQAVRAWARHDFGGVVESIAVLPSPDGTRDDVWMVVRRMINGAERRYVEIIRPEYASGQAQASATYVDSGLTYSGDPATTIYGLDHLEGENVRVLADGAAGPDVSISNGEAVLATAASVVQIGLGYSAIYGSSRIAGGAGDGTAQGKTKRVTDCVWRVADTFGGVSGPSEVVLDDIPDLMYRAPVTPMDSPPPLFTGDAHLSWPGGYETDCRLWYINDSSFPATIVAAMPQVVVQETR